VIEKGVCRAQLLKSLMGDQDAGGSSVVQSDDTHQQAEMHEDEVPILKRLGGSNLLVQLTKGDPAALNSKARNRPFARNRGPRNGMSDQDFSQKAEDVLVDPDAFPAIGLHIYRDFPKLEERDGDFNQKSTRRAAARDDLPPRADLIAALASSRRFVLGFGLPDPAPSLVVALLPRPSRPPAAAGVSAMRMSLPSRSITS